MRRRTLLALLGGAAIALPGLARAQPADRTYRIGFLANDPSIPETAAGKAFVERLAQNGFVEGKNLAIERRFAASDRGKARVLAKELAGLGLDVIVSSGEGPTLAAKEATAVIPIVMVNVIDPIGAHIIDSLVSHAGNLTGTASSASWEIEGKRLDLLKEAIPAIARVAVLLQIGRGQVEGQRDSLTRAAAALSLSLDITEIRDSADMDGALDRIIAGHPDALLVANSSLGLMNRKRIIALTAGRGIPTFYPFVEQAQAGGLLAYGASRSAIFRRAADFVGRILHGAKPESLPIEQPTKYDLAINLTTAKALGLTIPPALLARADEVIE